jgi:hypothetical protein
MSINVTYRSLKVLKKWRIKAKIFKYIHSKVYKKIINNYNFNPLYLYNKNNNRNKILILNCNNNIKILILEIKIIYYNKYKEL